MSTSPKACMSKIYLNPSEVTEWDWKSTKVPKEDGRLPHLLHVGTSAGPVTATRQSSTARDEQQSLLRGQPPFLGALRFSGGETEAVPLSLRVRPASQGHSEARAATTFTVCLLRRRAECGQCPRQEDPEGRQDHLKGKSHVFWTYQQTKKCCFNGGEGEILHSIDSMLV